MSFSLLCHNFIQLNSVYLNMFCWCEWILTRLCTVELNNSARQMTHLNEEKRFSAQSGTYNSITVRSPFKLAKTEVSASLSLNKFLSLPFPNE